MPEEEQQHFVLLGEARDALETFLFENYGPDYDQVVALCDRINSYLAERQPIASPPAAPTQSKQD